MEGNRSKKYFLQDINVKCDVKEYECLMVRGKSVRNIVCQ